MWLFFVDGRDIGRDIEKFSSVEHSREDRCHDRRHDRCYAHDSWNKKRKEKFDAY